MQYLQVKRIGMQQDVCMYYIILQTDLHWTHYGRNFQIWSKNQIVRLPIKRLKYDIIGVPG